MPKKENEPIDWAGIERDYRAGVMSVREIAKWYGVSHTAINKRAKADGWTREAQPKHFDRKALVGEIVSVKALRGLDDALSDGHWPAYREHVTSYIRENQAALTEWRYEVFPVTVDTPDDYARLKP